MSSYLFLLLSVLAGEQVLDGFEYADAPTARAAWKPSDGTPPVDVGADDDRKVLVVTAPFAADKKMPRAVIDRAAKFDLRSPGEFRLQVAVDQSEACRRWTLYFHSGAGWYACGAALSENRADERRPRYQTLVFKKANFGSEDRPAGWDKIDGIRLSAWRSANADARIRLRRLVAVTNEIAMVVPDGKAWQATGEQRTAHDQAAMVADMLDDVGLGCDWLAESTLADTLAGHRVAILAYNPGLSREAETALVNFVERGGKVFVCYLLPARLGQALGFGQAKYVKPDDRGQLASIAFAGGPLGRLGSVKQASWNITDARPIGQNAKIIGRWRNGDGTETGHAALLLSDRGAFFSHIVLSDDWLTKRSMLVMLLADWMPDVWPRIIEQSLDRCGRVGHCENWAELAPYVGPRLLREWTKIENLRDVVRQRAAQRQYLDAFLSVQELSQMASAAYILSTPPRKGEVRAVWNHSGTGAFPGDWRRSIDLLADNGFAMVLPNMLWGGLAHYESDLLPRSETFRRHGDQIEQCCDAAAKRGIEVHVWKVNYNLSTAPRAFIDTMRKADRTQVDYRGKPLNWLCPSHPDNQRLERESMLEVLRKYPVAGLHFDYIRYPGDESCYCDGCRQRFERESKRPVEHWPKDCHGGPRHDEYNNWRCRQITALVESVSREARRIKPQAKISAAVFGSYPDCRKYVAQDWPAWIKAGYLDFVCPMDYTTSDDEFKRLVRSQMKLVDGRAPVYPGIGLSASHRGLSIDRAVGQLHWARELGAAGCTIFEFNAATADVIAPAFGLGPGRKASGAVE